MASPEFTPSVEAPPRRRPLFVLGVLLFLAGPIGYAIQVSLAQWFVPWYVPVLATLGILCMAASVCQRPGVWRSIGLAFFVLIGAFEWFMLLVGTNTPAYAGPAQVGKKVPAFTTQLASGAAFTEKDLANGGKSVLVFFRGRW